MTAPAAEPLHPEQLKRQLTDVVLRQAAQQPRNLQTQLGPSGLGEPCTLRLALGILETPATNPVSDPLPSVVGTGAHAMFAGFFEQLDERLPDGRPRYLIEQRVTPRDDIPGSSDLFDRLHGAVIDWKFMGQTKLDSLRRRGPGLRYRVQSHVYGLGFENAGETVQHVAVVGVPRGGFLSGMQVWTEPYDRQVALDALERKDATTELIGRLRLTDHPERWALIPRTPGPECRYCPFLSPGLTAPAVTGCPGHVPAGVPSAPTPEAFLGTAS